MILGTVSDLHLNFSGVDIPTEGLDALAIVGDTSPHHEQTATWIARTLPASLPVLLVMGNHDYEGHRLDRAAESLTNALRAQRLDNVHVLDNRAVVLNGVRFLGTPLWTRFDAFEPHVMRHAAEAIAKHQICDFGAILSREGRLLTPGDMALEHLAARDFLLRELSREHAGKTVVLTHFLPSPQCCDTRFRGSPLNPYFATDVEGLVARADLWLHGHTHASVDRVIQGTRVVCNPRGYSRTFGLSENPDWDPAFRIDLTDL